MKLNIIELRDMVADAVRQVVREAKKDPKLPAPRSEESIAAERKRRLTGLPGYANCDVLDMSKPLGKRNLAKRQGQANTGNWTSEAVQLAEPSQQRVQLSVGELIDLVTGTGADAESATAAVNRWLEKRGMVDPVANGLNDPTELGIEAKNEAIRHLVRLVVAEEIRVRR